MQRLFALDVFRGLTILLMIMVNSPGTYGTFSHAYWDGITFADFVFPFFIVIVGVAIALGHKPALSAGAKSQLLKKVLKRSLIMFALGLFVNLIYLKFSDIRVLGVLQRIAMVYLVCSVLVLYCQTRTLWLTGAGLLIGYWLLILLVPAPGLVAGQLERGANLINWFDSAFLPGMLWRGSWDPEGVLSTIPAIASGLAGVLMLAPVKPLCLTSNGAIATCTCATASNGTGSAFACPPGAGSSRPNELLKYDPSSVMLL